MLIIAVVVAVTIGITKAKLDNVVSYTYLLYTSDAADEEEIVDPGGSSIIKKK